MVTYICHCGGGFSLECNDSSPLFFFLAFGMEPGRRDAPCGPAFSSGRKSAKAVTRHRTQEVWRLSECGEKRT